MTTTRCSLFGLALAAGLASGCGNGPPGGGLTNGPAPDLSAEKPAMRTDMPERNRTDQGELKGAGGTDTTPVRDMENAPGSTTSGTPAVAGTGGSKEGGQTNAGTGGQNRAGGPPAKDPAPRGGADRKDTVEAVGSAGAQPPSTKDSSAVGSAAGATKPQGNIKVGTPTGPQ